MGDGVRLVSSVLPERSPSDELTRYPADPLAATPEVQAATLRVAPVSAVKGRLQAQRPTMARAPGRQLPKVLAARRSMRRQGVTPTR